MNEIDLYPTWIPIVTRAYNLTQVSRFRKFVYVRADKVPFPFESRDVCIFGYGVDSLDEDTITIIARDCEQQHDHNHVLESPGCTRIDLTMGGALLKPLSPTETFVTIVANVDPKVAIIPYALLNWGTKTLVHYVFLALRDLTKNLEGSEFEERLKTSPTYVEIRPILDNYFLSKNREFEQRTLPLLDLF